MTKIKYRVSGDWRGTFSTFERALKRARELRTMTGQAFDVLEIDRGCEAPIAHVAPKRAPKLIQEPTTNYDRSVIR